MFNVCFEYGNDMSNSKLQRQTVLENMGNEFNIRNSVLTIVPVFHDKESDINWQRIIPRNLQTFFIYVKRDGELINSQTQNL